MKANNLSTPSRLSNAEFLQIMKNTVDLTERNSAPGLNLDTRIAELKTSILDFEEVFQTPTYHELTPEIRDANEKRLNALRALKKMLDSNKLIGGELSKPVRMLTNNFDNHIKQINRLNSAQRTACIDAMHKDWTEMPELNAAMNSLQLEKWLTTLKTANQQFDNLFVQRTETSRKSANTKAKRIVIKSLFDNLVRDIEAHIRLSDTSQPYEDLLVKINNLLKGYKSLNKTGKKDNAGQQATEVKSW